jgi:hypothetical protein
MRFTLICLLVFALFLTACGAESAERNKGKAPELTEGYKTAFVNYRDAVFSAADRFATKGAQPTDAADAALASAGKEEAAYRAEVEKYFSAIVTDKIKAARAADKHLSETRGKLHGLCKARVIDAMPKP